MANRTFHPGDLIRSRRVLLKLTQDELAERAGCNAKAIYRIEKSGRLTLELAQSIARALECAVGDLIPSPTDIEHAGKGGKRARRASGNVSNSAKTSRQRSQGPTAKRAEKAA